MPTGFEAVSVLAAAVAVLLLWTILSPILGVSLIVSSSTSLAPEISAGSFTLIRTVPASTVAVGDTVIVQPVGGTELVAQHVTAKSDPYEGIEVRTLSLAPTTADPSRAVKYAVSAVGLVVFSVPELGNILNIVATPFVIILILALLAAMDLWAREPRIGYLHPHRGARIAALH